MLRIHSGLSVLPGILCLGPRPPESSNGQEAVRSGTCPAKHRLMENVGSQMPNSRPVGGTLHLLRMFVARTPGNQVKTKGRTAAFQSMLTLLMLVGNQPQATTRVNGRANRLQRNLYGVLLILMLGVPNGNV